MALIDDPSADLGDLGRRFEAWLQRQPGGAGRAVTTVDQASRANGFSNETYRLTLSAPLESIILRLPPARTGLFPGYDLPRQYAFMQQLHARPGLRLPPCRWLETDPAYLGRPFFVTACIAGDVAPDRPCYVREGWLHDATPVQQRRLWDGTVSQLARLAQVRWRGAALHRLDWPDRGTPRVRQHISHWQRLAAWGRSQLPTEDTHFADALCQWLLDHAPRNERAGVVWGDARFGNVIARDFEPVALLDWELAVIADPMLDIAYFLFHQFLMELLHGDAGTATRFAGFRGDEETLGRWCDAAQRSPRGYRWCWLFNAWKILCIWECKAALLLRSGHSTVDEALEVRRGARLLPHIERVLAGGEEAAFVRPSPPLPEP